MTEAKSHESLGRYTLDVRGHTCPYPQYYTIKALRDLHEGDVLEVVLDNQPSLGIVQDTARKRGCIIISVDKIEENTWRIVIGK